MISLSQLLLFAGAALLMALTPGPNMLYLLSRSLCQGRMAGIMSWCGVVLGFSVHMLCAAIGLTALFMTIPLGYELLKVAGALYLLWLAWQGIRPGASSPFEPTALAAQSLGRLFLMGLLTSVLNPKVAIFYLSVLPQFIAPDAGSVLSQSLQLGTVQVLISAVVNLMVALSAARLALWFARHRLWLAVQRYVMATVLGLLAVRLLAQGRS
ncbi:LysE family translocator [Aeromonas encheleia]|uniref:LysE family translocator n=1 Tax=Aeromonas encheleia TaxID=73010 RepID=UPI001F58BE78|nr:LysE family transporter [Aeromonas encheleia]UNP90518.1 LysE family translocator [Aeromonas encheleia]